MQDFSDSYCTECINFRNGFHNGPMKHFKKKTFRSTWNICKTLQAANTTHNVQYRFYFLKCPKTYFIHEPGFSYLVISLLVLREGYGI